MLGTRKRSKSKGSTGSRKERSASVSEVKPHWMRDRESDACLLCASEFTLARRRHHCRQCGRLVCNECSGGRKELPEYGYKAKVRVCNRCVSLDAEDEGKAASVLEHKFGRDLKPSKYAPFVELPFPLQHRGYDSKELWIASVRGYSSQYSPNGWNANKLIGKPTVFPNYGDHSGAWAPRNAGNAAGEWIEVRIAKKLIITALDIYETLKPGAVTKIEALAADDTWTTIFTGPPMHSSLPAISRIFKPELSNKTVFSDTIKLTLTTMGSDNWNEIDAIKVTGLDKMSRKPKTPSPNSFEGQFSALYAGMHGGSDKWGIAAPPCDVTFLLEQGSKKVTAHRAVLWARSEVFRTMLSEDNPESSVASFKVEQFTAQTFEHLMHFTYCGFVSLDDPSDLFGLYFAADKFLYPDLRDKMVEELGFCVTTANVFDLLELVDKMGTAAFRLKEPLFKYIKDNLKQNVHNSPAFNELSKHLVVQVFKYINKSG